MIEIRERRDEDADVLVAALARVHERDRYPTRRQNVRWGWLTDGVEPGWTALADGLPIGHVGLKAPAAGSLLPDGALEVTRLFVDPATRGTGAAGLLLDAAEAHAAAIGRPLGLEVVVGSDAAVAFYERRGWRPVGEREADWLADDGVRPRLLGYVG